MTAVADAVGMSLHYGTEIEQAREGRQWLEAAGDVSTELLGGGDPERAQRDRRARSGIERVGYCDRGAAV